MRRKLWLLALFIAAIGVYFAVFYKKEEPAAPEPEKQKPIVQSKYSAAFNEQVHHALTDYDGLKERYVNWDSAGLKPEVDKLQASLGALSFEELKKDPAIYETVVSMKDNFKNDLDGIRNAPNLTESRHSFNSLSQNLYDLLRTIRYDGSSIYLQECPMAFNDEEAAVWLSTSSAVRNPYLGLHHPKYHSGMLECGGPKDSLRFAANK
ncbi:DUF3347 domain-containing protein [Flaviaesturariibacter flavus]|uniref:DUF3347 domain-containing protein n=1 Tax=Flaviaesturariibacter flavus TaxID=2502780 RepID=A0A4R1BNF6_9BACT|nr:DUF3347 domain-containing protein [Flaviaesturariibacter flavus]TCJ19059.1 DUF3347 domain-containing protein [Flaviaesturariibacter flavus]